jgi:hypothetical protein
MRYLSLTLAILLAAPLAAQEAKKSEWVKVASDKGKFEVLFPTKPTSPGAGEGAQQFLLESADGKSALLAQVNVYPEKIDLQSKETIDDMFKRALEGLQGSFKGSKVVEIKEITFDKKYRGKDVDLEVPDLGIYRTRWIATETGFIQLAVLGPKDYIKSDEVKKFFESLKITGK